MTIMHGSLVKHRTLAIGGIAIHGNHEGISLGVSSTAAANRPLPPDELVPICTGRTLIDGQFGEDGFASLQMGADTIRYKEPDCDIITYRPQGQELSFLITLKLMCYADHDLYARLIGGVVKGEISDLLVIRSEKEIDESIGTFIAVTSEDENGEQTSLWREISDDSLALVRLSHAPILYQRFQGRQQW